MQLARRDRPSACTSSWAARPRSSCSTTPTSTPPSTEPSPASLINTGQDCTAATRAYVQRPLYDDFVARGRRPDGDGAPRADRTTRPPTRARWSRCAQRSRSPGSCERARGYGAKVVTRRSRSRRRAGRGRLLRAHPGRRCRPGLRDRPGGALRPGARGAARSTTTTRGCDWPTTRPTAWPPRCGHATCSGRCGPPARSRPACVWVNDHIPIISEMPHGGYKQSGFGKDMSTVLVRGVHATSST